RTVGRRTRQPRTAALLYVRDGDAYAVIASKGGAPQHPGWYHNLVATPDVEIQVGRERIPVRARVAQGEERARRRAHDDAGAAVGHERVDAAGHDRQPGQHREKMRGADRTAILRVRRNGKQRHGAEPYPPPVEEGSATHVAIARERR